MATAANKEVGLVDRAARPFTRLSLLAVVGFALGFWGLLYLEGRPGWCKNGIGFWSAAWQNCTSQHLFDPYTLSHVLHGIIFYWLLRPLAGKLSLAWRMIAGMAVEIGWELLENSPWVIERYRQQTASLDYTGDSMLNAMGDLMAAVAGFYFASRVSWKWAVAVFIVFELLALYLARDNLILNVIMLFLPLESLKEWQMQGM
jgi:hypothetical protein